MSEQSSALADYVRLEGSERRPSPTARLIGPADPNETMSVTIMVRRGPDTEPLPDFGYFDATPPAIRPRLTEDEFARRYGAAPDELEQVARFAAEHGLTVAESNAARRTVVVSGTVEQMSRAFNVPLATYEHTLRSGRNASSRTERYRGRDGFVSVPSRLAPLVKGVFGLDNRTVAIRNGGDPPGTAAISVQTVRVLYDFPANSAAGQTIGILSLDGYHPDDIKASFGGSPPVITDVAVDARNSGNADVETTQDIVIAGQAAPGAAIAVYFTTGSQQGWVDLVGRVVHPAPTDPVCSVLSSSFYVSNGDDANALKDAGVSRDWMYAVSTAFNDAAVQKITVCIASGDTGSDSKIGDGKVHVQYPGSDPWVLSCGGTTIGSVRGATCTEYAWNDSTGASGGGVSDAFPVPSYQGTVKVPASMSTGKAGRGVPDVAANASPYSGYTGITVGGKPFTGNGTSAAAPLWAGLIAVLNANLGIQLGFVNPVLYRVGAPGFKDIIGAPGPADNAFNKAPGYPVGAGWDAVTGWGSPQGGALLDALAQWSDWFDPLPSSPWRFDHTRQHVAVVSRAPGNLDVFVLGENNELFTCFWVDGCGWSDWFQLPARTGFHFDENAEQLVVVSRAPDCLDVLVLADNDKMFWLPWKDGVWAPDWTDPLPSSPWRFDHTRQRLSVVSRAPANLDVFVLGENNELFTCFWVDGHGWSDWFQLPPHTGFHFDEGTEQLVTISRTSDSIDVLVLADNDKMFWLPWKDGAWAPDWIDPLPSSPWRFDHTRQRLSVVSRTPANLDVFVLGENNELFTCFWVDGRGWSDWFQLPASTGFHFDEATERLAVVSRTPDSIDVLVLADNDKMFWLPWNGQWARDWIDPLPFSPLRFDHTRQRLAVVSRAPVKLDVFVLGNNDKLFSATWPVIG